MVLVYFGLDENECGQLEKLIKVLYSLSTLLRATLLSYALVFSKPSLADGLENALSMRASGDFKSSLQIIYPLAIRGNANAQILLADMYSNGEGVIRDSDKALYWACRAIETETLETLIFHKKLTIRLIDDTYIPWSCPSKLDIKSES